MLQESNQEEKDQEYYQGCCFPDNLDPLGIVGLHVDFLEVLECCTMGELILGGYWFGSDKARTRHMLISMNSEHEQAIPINYYL